MNGWQALEVYDLMNDGHGNYQFHNTKHTSNRDKGYKTGFLFFLDARKKEKELRRLIYQEGLDKP